MNQLADALADLEDKAPQQATQTTFPIEDIDNQLREEPKEEVKEEPKEETPAETPETPAEEQPEVVVDEDEPINPDSGVDITAIAEELGIEAKDVDELKEAIKGLKTTAESKFANETVKQINDYVLNGGDVKTYLEAEKEVTQLQEYQAALDSIDPKEAYKESLKQMNLTEDEVEEILDTMTEAQIKLEGRKVINQEKAVTNQLIKEKEDKRSNMLAQQTEKQNKIKGIVHSAVDKLEVIQGVTVTAKDKAALKSYAPNDLIRKYFPLGEDGLPKADVWAKSAALLEFGERNAQLLKQKVSSQTKKDEFKKLHNVEQPVRADIAKEQKGSTSASLDEIPAIFRM